MNNMPYRSPIKDLVVRKTVEELVLARDRSIKLYSDGHKLIKMAMAETTEIDRMGAIHIRDFPSPSDITKEIDRKTWRLILNLSGMESLMNATQKSLFEEQIQDAPPKITTETVNTTLTALFSRMDDTFIEGMVDVFKLLDKKYKTNNSFKLGHRIIFHRAADKFGFWSYFTNNPKDLLIDLERIVYVINKRKPPKNIDDISNKLYDYLCTTTVVELEYMTCKTFKNGNIHVEITCSGTINKINTIIANYYGNSLSVKN